MKVCQNVVFICFADGNISWTFSGASLLANAKRHCCLKLMKHSLTITKVNFKNTGTQKCYEKIFQKDSDKLTEAVQCYF